MRAAKKILAVILAALTAFSLTGCALFGEAVTFEPEESGLFIRRDRSIVGAEIADFDNSAFDTPRYSEDELKEFVETEVRAYNAENAGQNYCYAEEIAEQKDLKLPVMIEKLQVVDKVATLLIDYAGYRDYLAFNGTTNAVPVQNLIVGTVADGVSSGLDFAGMVKIEKGAETGPADTAEIAKNTKYLLVAVTGTTPVAVEGTLCYISEGLELISGNAVRCSGSETQYMIFK